MVSLVPLYFSLSSVSDGTVGGPHMPSGLHTGLFYIEGRARCTLEPCSRSDKSMLYHNAIANLRVFPHNSTCSSYQYLCISYSFAVMYVWYSSVVLRNTIAIRSHTILRRVVIMPGRVPQPRPSFRTHGSHSGSTDHRELPKSSDP